MNQKKSKPIAVWRLILAVTLLLMCAVVMVGVTWARYQEEENSYLKYNTRKPATISVWSDYTDGILSGKDNVIWTTSGGKKTAYFYISNGTSVSDCADEDLSATIRLLVSLNAADAEVDLTVFDGGPTLMRTGVPVPIQKNTPLHDTFGGGNTYIFRTEDGKELSWDLEGGALSVLAVQINVRNLENIEDAALLQLQIVGK